MLRKRETRDLVVLNVVFPYKKYIIKVGLKQRRINRMKMDAEKLRNDLTAFYEMSSRLNLPVKCKDHPELISADESELITVAADEGWDLGKYITEY